MSKKQSAGHCEPVRIAVRDLPTIGIDELRPYARNAKRHGAAQIEKLRASLREFGFVAPVLIDEENNVIAGHGRIEAARAEGMTAVPYVRVSDLTEAQRRAYIIADNRLSELGEWDMEALNFEMKELSAFGFDETLTGFAMEELTEIADSDKTRDTPNTGAPIDLDKLSTEGGEADAEYSAFVDKFRRKLTTDDCYTPPNVYAAVRDWAVSHYDLGDAPIVRPFYPGGDYKAFAYPEGCVVVDNPPFSIISEIVRFYMTQGIRFFLFAPALTLFSIAAGEANYIATSCRVTFENGANVRIGFVHNLGCFKIETAPELYSAVAQANAENTAPETELPDYTYPDAVATPIRLAPMARYERFSVRAEDCRFIRSLDAQKTSGKVLYGGGFLLSEKAAAEKAAAEKAAAEKAAAEKAAAEKAAAEKAAAKKRNSTVWELSAREREIVAGLGHDGR